MKKTLYILLGTIFALTGCGGTIGLGSPSSDEVDKAIMSNIKESSKNWQMVGEEGTDIDDPTFGKSKFYQIVSVKEVYSGSIVTMKNKDNYDEVVKTFKEYKYKFNVCETKTYYILNVDGNIENEEVLKDFDLITKNICDDVKGKIKKN